jgi:hypothetical protein
MKIKKSKKISTNEAYTFPMDSNTEPTPSTSNYLNTESEIEPTHVYLETGTGTGTSTSQDDINELRQKVDALERRLLNGNYMYKDAVIYNDIFDAFENNIFSKIGDPVGWDENSYTSRNPFNGRPILNIGNNDQVDRNGIELAVPDGYDVFWVRVINDDRWETFNLRPSKVPHSKWGKDITACGRRSLLEISPDGTSPEVSYKFHQWCPMPIRKVNGKIPNKIRVWTGPNTNSGGWISGIAFSKNLWNHAKNSAVAYLWTLNGGTPVSWNSDNWNNDNLGRIQSRAKSTMMVPVVPSGKDKLVYIAEHNNNWLGVMHGDVKVNDVSIERFRTSYTNPFATHFNSKIYSRYMAAKIPADLIKNDDKFIKLEIDMTNCEGDLHFREIGSHDFI